MVAVRDELDLTPVQPIRVRRDTNPPSSTEIPVRLFRYRMLNIVPSARVCVWPAETSNAFAHRVWTKNIASPPIEGDSPGGTRDRARSCVDVFSAIESRPAA